MGDEGRRSSTSKLFGAIEASSESEGGEEQAESVSPSEDEDGEEESYEEEEVYEEYTESGEEGSYDVVLDCAGTTSAVEASCDALRAKGTLLMLASSWESFEFPGLTVAAKELDIVMSTMYGRSGTARDVDAAAGLLGQDESIADALISDRFALSDAPAAFERSRDRQGGAIKVALEP